jgi:hypothetical protein
MARRERYEDDDDRDEPRRKKPFPVLWVVAGVVGAMVLLGIVGIGGLIILAAMGRPSNASSVTAASNEPDFSNATLVKAGVEHRIGDFGITVDGGENGVVQYVEFGQYSSPTNAFIVGLKVVNYNPNKLNKIGPATPNAVLVDSLGQTYKAFYLTDRFGNQRTTPHQIGSQELLVLRSDEKETFRNDLVAFTTPPVGAKSVTVYLSEKPYGGTGWLKFEALNKKNGT